LIIQEKVEMSPQTLEAPIDEFIDSLKPDGALVRDVIIRIVDGKKVTRDEVRHALIESDEPIDGFKCKLQIARRLRDAVETIKNATVPDERISALRTAKDDANKAVEDELERHEADVARLLGERRAATDAYVEASYPYHTAYVEAKGLINTHQSDDARERFNKASNAAVNLSNRLVKLREETAFLAFRVSRLQADGKGDELKPLPEMQETLAKLQAELETVTAEYDSAKSALETIECDVTSDWRLMNFDRPSLGSGRRSATSIPVGRRLAADCAAPTAAQT
jgi:hypothetical protein